MGNVNINPNCLNQAWKVLEGVYFKHHFPHNYTTFVHLYALLLTCKRRHFCATLPNTKQHSFCYESVPRSVGSRKAECRLLWPTVAYNVGVFCSIVGGESNWVLNASTGRETWDGKGQCWLVSYDWNFKIRVRESSTSLLNYYYYYYLMWIKIKTAKCTWATVARIVAGRETC